MKKRREADLPARLVQGRERFERWRKKQTTRTRLPERLWSAAVKLAREYGVSRTARVLRLDYNGLKQRMESRVSGDTSPTSVGPQFLQLLGSELTAVAECAIECQDAQDTKIRIHLKGPQLPDLAALIGSLWNGGR